MGKKGKQQAPVKKATGKRPVGKAPEVTAAPSASGTTTRSGRCFVAPPLEAPAMSIPDPLLSAASRVITGHVLATAPSVRVSANSTRHVSFALPPLATVSRDAAFAAGSASGTTSGAHVTSTQSRISDTSFMDLMLDQIPVLTYRQTLKGMLAKTPYKEWDLLHFALCTFESDKERRDVLVETGELKPADANILVVAYKAYTSSGEFKHRCSRSRAHILTFSSHAGTRT